VVYGQISSYQAQVRNELERRGLDEEQLRALLYERNIDLDNLDILTSEQILELQRAIDELDQLQGSRFESFTGRIDTLPDDPLIPSGEGLVKEDTLVIDEAFESDDTIKIYGHHLFEDGRIEVISAENSVTPPPSYRIGTGDILSVSIYARSSQMDESFPVLSDGSITIREGLVKVFVRGLTLTEARTKLIQNFRRYYGFRDSEFNLQVGTVRNISVQIFGEVQSPGNYTVSGLNSVLNIIAAAGGLLESGSVRNIQLVKAGGSAQNFDLYQLLTDPANQENFLVEDGDLIFVPASIYVVSIEGSVNRPMQYELKENEGIFELIEYAGGLERNAYLPSIGVRRYTGDRRIMRSVPYAANLKTRTNFPLQDGDEVLVSSIREQVENLVTVTGEVRIPGNFELMDGMRLSQLIAQAGLMRTSRTDLALLKRTNADGTINLYSVSIDDLMSGAFPLLDMELQHDDELIVWPMERFADNKFVIVDGAVRDPQQFPYDESGTLRVSDAITLAGGLTRNAASFAHLHRLDPLNPNELSYVRLDLSKLIIDPQSADNIVLEPFDSIHVYVKDEFYDDLTISIGGAVNNPGTFLFGEGMDLSDAILLAGGLKRSAATNNIEISRVIIEENRPTRTVVESIALSRDEILNSDTKGTYALEPFDNVFVRFVPEFELQQNVTLDGEVSYPGDYSLIRENETVFDVIQRAGGLTEEAFPAAATLYRAEDSLGQIVMRLDEVMMNPSSRYNYTLKSGDVVTIPKKKDYITIAGYTQYLVQSSEKWINVPYHQGRNAQFYVDFYAGGFADDARRDKIFVRYPNGEVKSTVRRFPFGKKHPEVLPGSIIEIGQKKPDLTSRRGDEDVNWTKVLGDSVAQAMSILTLILLIERLD
jgi:protein involved in polysaccharide export with SLBB domain